ncbi:jhy protein homolog isoform X2 [Etheostoma spectabile]|uniref:jhy protein homolog isoform X2 n=1 Tax=Etheostoma spectabile TaxID=54343 RepID=UPI0013AFC576|nr:jhy protein homolog isoform X2 [Etheostoma spectabile]
MKHTNMDEGLKHEKMTQVLTERGRPPSPRPAVLTNQWDSVESDTESLAQERAYQQQQQLQMPIGRHDQNKYILPQKENADSLQQGHKEAEYANDNKTEDLQVCDSLDVAAHPHANRNPTLSQTEYLDTQMDERAGTSQLLTDDVYSELRYDPNWRTNLRGASCFNENPRISVEEYYEVPKEKSRQSCGDSQGLRIKAGYRYIIDTSPAAVVTPHLTGNESDQPYRLHPQHGQTGSVTSPHCHNHALQLGSPEADHSKPSCIFTKDDSDNAGEYSRSPEQPNDICAMSKNIHERTQGGPTQIQQMSTPSVPKVLLNKKLERLTEDIVERNKKTLGRNTSKCGSYVSVHALNREMPHPVNKGHGTLKKTASTDSQEDSSDPKPKTQQLRVTQISEGKKAQRKENPNRPPQQQQTPALGVSAESEDRLSSSLAKPAAAGQPNPQKTTSSQPLVSNIHLNTSSTLLPLIQQRGQEDIINLACSDACPNWSPLSELALSPGYQLTIPGRSSQTSHKGVSAHLHQQNLESSPEQWQRTAALKWLLSCEGEDQKCPNEVQTKQFPPNLPRTPTTTFSGSYTVLPPITESTAGKEPELSPGVNTAYPIHSSCSDSYLGQMEKQKQLRTRVAYKAYSLKDYKQLKSDINLRGLGPDYSAIEKTKMKRQKLYSNVIREQNKTISRIPFLLAKDPEGNDKKVPRMKALEYAKTIAKPPVQSQPKQRPKHRSEGFTEPAPYLEDLDVSQLATLEVLRKRHEEEKQAVALFRKVHAV